MGIQHHSHSAVKPGQPGSGLFPNSPLGEQVDGIPTGRDVDWEPLVDYRRNGVSETTIHGAVAWAHGDEVIHSFGGNVLCYGRSMMKPFMLKAFVKELEPFTWEQKAIAEQLSRVRCEIERAKDVVDELKDKEKGLEERMSMLKQRNNRII